MLRPGIPQTTKENIMQNDPMTPATPFSSSRPETAPDNTAGTMRDELGRCLDEFRSVSEEKLPDVRQRIDALVADAGKVGHAYYDSMRHASSRLAAAAGNDLHRSCEATAGYVRANPWRSLTITGALAFVAGLLFTRR
jgi:ElaB/YqjD/DUF883 family membrane-anchored ribosome-binding protein